ncbi:MAG: CPBP family intramembrane metalloprotease [Actinomycetota bacterium]|nr:CPBP family intramembrane metalloprotease [Actinomycetota bacterium]
MIAAGDRGRLAAWLAVVGGFSALAYFGRFSGGEQPDEPLYLWSSAAAGAIQFGIFLLLVALIARGRPFREYLAVRRPTSWGRAALIAVVVVGLVWLLGLALQPVADPGEEQNLIPEGWNPAHAAPFAANFVVVALLAPVVEELLFRGLGYTLLEPLGRWTAIAVTAAAFALAHGLVEGFPLLVLFGAGLAYMRARVRSIVPGILVHIAFNTVVLLAAVRFFQESG